MLTPDGRTVIPQEEVLEKSSVLFRIHSNRFPPAKFNPGDGPAKVHSRFAFFGNPPVPVLYAAATSMGAISETLLRDVPLHGGRLVSQMLENKILSLITNTVPLRLLALHGHGFRRIGTSAEDVTRTVPWQYSKSVPWAVAAFEAGFDGITWMSRHHDTSQAYVFFERPEHMGVFQQHPDPAGVRIFAVPQDMDWLTRQLAPLNVWIGS